VRKQALGLIEQFAREHRLAQPRCRTAGEHEICGARIDGRVFRCREMEPRLRRVDAIETEQRACADEHALGSLRVECDVVEFA
jgi:hypothetical protein